MKYLLYFLLSFKFSFAQLHKDSISFDFFYKRELENIVKLKNKIKINNNILLKIELAESYNNINIEDSAYSYYYNVFENKNLISKKQLVEILFKLHIIESSKSNYSKDRRFFLNSLNDQIKDNDQEWKAKFQLEKAKDLFLDSINFNKSLYYINLAKKSKYYQNNLSFQYKVLLVLGNYYTLINEFSLAEKTLFQGLKLTQKFNDKLFSSYFYINIAVNFKMKKNYNKAIEYLNLAEKSTTNLFKPKIYRVIYSNKMECFNELNYDLEYKNSNIIFNKLDSLINDFQKNSNFYEIDSKYQLQEKEKKIQSLSKNKILYLTLIFLVFLLAIYSFIRWKKVDLNKKKISLEKDNLELEKENLELLKENLVLEKENLEIQHHQTLEQLEKVKQLVIEDHIILKNKAKIYLEDLIYIVADDHYLNFVTTHKKEFIRGKITEIIQELPPNFVKCHRSYIVNKNFIKSFLKTEVLMQNNESVPVSRNFKF